MKRLLIATGLLFALAAPVSGAQETTGTIEVLTNNPTLNEIQFITQTDNVRGNQGFYIEMVCRDADGAVVSTDFNGYAGTFRYPESATSCVGSLYWQNFHKPGLNFLDATEPFAVS